MTRVIAVDWSGRAKGAAEYIWLAEAVAGRLVALENGRDRDEVIAEVVRRSPPLVGLDFAFGFPEWWARRWGDARQVWEAARDHGEEWLRDCEPPFWGRPGKPRPAGEQLRVTDRGGAKSVFQIGGAGAVGTGSIRGMPHLLTLAAAGFSIWPFEQRGERVVVEIYPRAFTGPVNKSSRTAREALLRERYADSPLRGVAAASEDAFDAAVSALEMSRSGVVLDWNVGERARIEGLVSPVA